MIDAGCLENVDRIYGTHLWSGYPTGTIHSRAGAIMASQMNLVSQLKVVAVMVPNLMKPLTQ